jgi:hypothetical protein
LADIEIPEDIQYALAATSTEIPTIFLTWADGKGFVVTRPISEDELLRGRIELDIVQTASLFRGETFIAYDSSSRNGKNILTQYPTSEDVAKAQYQNAGIVTFGQKSFIQVAPFR